MIEHRIHIRWKYRMIMVIDYYCRIGPPQKSLRERRTIINLHFYFYISFARIKRKSLHTFGAEHSLHDFTVFLMFSYLEARERLAFYALG